MAISNFASSLRLILMLLLTVLCFPELAWAKNDIELLKYPIGTEKKIILEKEDLTRDSNYKFESEEKYSTETNALMPFGFKAKVSYVFKDDHLDHVSYSGLNSNNCNNQDFQQNILTMMKILGGNPTADFYSEKHNFGAEESLRQWQNDTNHFLLAIMIFENSPRASWFILNIR